MLNVKIKPINKSLLHEAHDIHALHRPLETFEVFGKYDNYLVVYFYPSIARWWGFAKIKIL